MNATLHAAGDADILRARARLLARRPQEAADALREASLEVLEFQLGPDRYALDTRYVRGVHALRDMTPLPCSPAFVLGIVSVRGRMVPVIGLKRFFDLAESGLTDLHRLVLVRHEDMEFGLPADVGISVRRIPLAGIQPASAMLVAPMARYISGITAEGVALLDMAAITADPRLLVDEKPQ